MAMKALLPASNLSNRHRSPSGRKWTFMPSTKAERRTHLEFAALDVLEQKWIIEETWCDKCEAADLGIRNPSRYAEDGREFVTGNCNVCGANCVSEIVRKDR